MEHDAMIGTSFAFVYSDETYRIDVLTDKRVRWTRTEGENPGHGDEEDYVFSQLASDIVLLSWVEADGLGLSNALRFSDMTVTTHANMGRQVFVNPGKLERLSR